MQLHLGHVGTGEIAARGRYGPETATVEGAEVQRAVFKGHVLQVRFHKRRACELAVLEGAAGESGAIEVAVGEVASLEYRIGKQRAGKVAAGEEAIREPGVGRLQLREILVGDDEAARVDGLQRFLCPAAQIVGLQGAQLFRNGRQRQGALGGGCLVGGLDGIGNSGHGAILSPA